MDIKSLKDKILQLAIQGKLVPQNENDEPASVLLENIKAEKEQLIKDKVIKKEKPLPEINEEEKLFEIPNSWECCRLGDIINISSGKNLTKKSMSEDGIIPVYGGNGITGYHNDYNVSEKTIVIGRVGFYCGSIHLTEEKAWVTDNAFITSYPKKYINREYLIMTLKVINLKGEESSTAQPVISGKKIYPLIIPIPPLEEQKRIVAKVDELFELIDELDNNKQELLENISNTRNKVLQLAIQGKLVEQCEDDEPASVLLERIKSEKEQLIKDKVIKKEKPLPEISEDEIYYDLPKGWEWVRLNDISRYIQRGKSPKYCESSNIPVISQKCVQWNGFDISKSRFIEVDTLEKYGEERYIKANDLLWNSTGKGTLGRINVYPGDIEYDIVVADSHVTVIRPIEINSKYLYSWFSGPIVQNEIDNKSTGSTKQTELSTATIKSYLVPVPPLEEQKRIVAKIDLIMDYLDKLQQEIESQEVILEDIL